MNRQHLCISKERIILRMVLAVLTAITICGVILLSYEYSSCIAGLRALLHYLRLLLLEPKLSVHNTIGDIAYALIVTLALSALTTIIASVTAFFLAIGAARNISFPLLSHIIMGGAAIIRSIPTIIWVLVFSVTVNIGTDAAVLGMAFHSTAYLIKGFSESFEHINRDTIDALRACGASFCSIITQAVLPSVRASLISWIFFRFEINVVNAVAIGAAAGAGGIGYHLFMAGNLYYDIHEVGFFTYTIFTAALILETISIKLRKKMRA